MSIAKFPFLLLLPFVSVCFRIYAEYSITIQSPSEDHVTDHIKHLFLTNVTFDRKSDAKWPGFSE